MTKSRTLKIASQPDEDMADELADELREAEAPRPDLPERPAPAPVQPSARAEAPQTAAPTVAPADSRQRGRGRLRGVLMLAGIAGVIIGGGFYWLRGGEWVSTDDAYIRAPKLMVSTDVSGIVSSVDVAEGQRVKAGDVLFKVDPQQFRIALDAATARLDLTRMNLIAARSDYQQIQSQIAAQSQQVQLDRINNERAAGLAQSNAGTKAAADQARFTLAADEARLEALRRQAESALTKLGGSPDTPVEKLPQYAEARTAVEEARRQLDHTVVKAPFSGVVTAVDKLQPGTFLVSQTAALTNTGAVALVGDEGLYIEANVKETDLTWLKKGDPADISVDAYPDQVWKGHVDSISPASGSEFSILPAQNASGNWVKVVQRVPIRLVIDTGPANVRLRAGISVVVDIDTGHKRKLADLAPAWLAPYIGQGHDATKP